MLSVVICAGLKYYEKLEADKKSSDPNAPAAAVITEDQLLFQKTYLAVYVCAFFADWLKGPYVYALYQSYGYSESQIA